MAWRIIMDAMGGDNAPTAIVRGAVLALELFDGSVTLVGDEGAIRRELAACGGEALVGQRLIIVHTDEKITMEDEPTDVVRKKKNSSMTVALKMLAQGEADAFVGAGNTGAMFMGASMIVRPFHGIRRAALAAILPMERPCLLLDCGANVTVTPEYLEQFAMMGSVYMENLFSVSKPAVGLLNNGAEPHKGTAVQIEAYQRLKNNPFLHFVGNVEGSDVPRGKCDVVVSDGFAGNILLKTTEGMGKFMMRQLKGLFFSTAATKLSAVFFKRQLMEMKHKFDVSEHGGSPFLGISKPVIKAHGSSDARAVKNAVRQALSYLDKDVSEKIRVGIAAVQSKQTQNAPTTDGVQSDREDVTA